MFFNSKKKIQKLLDKANVLISEEDEIYNQTRLLQLSGDFDECVSMAIEGFQKGYAKCKYFLASLVKTGKISYEIDTDAVLEGVFPIIEKLAKNNDDEARTILYFYYKNGFFVEKDLVKALEYCKQATGRGYYLAYLNLANECASNGMANSNTVEFLYEQAAKTEPVVQFFVSSLFETGKGGVCQNQEKSLYWLKKAVEGGEKRAQYTLASYYAIGKLVEKNLPLAKELAEKSYAQNYTQAKDLLIEIQKLETASSIQEEYAPVKVMAQMDSYNKLTKLLNKEKTLEEYKECVELMDALAGQNFGFGLMFSKNKVECTYRIALLEELRAESNCDWQETFNWFLKAKELGRKEATYHVAVMYYEGLGVDKDYQTAIKMFRDCIDSNIYKGEAYYYLGNCYSYGLFYEQDRNKANEYYQKAIEYGFSCQTSILRNNYEETELREEESLNYYGQEIRRREKDTTRYALLIEKDLKIMFGESWGDLRKEAKNALISGIDNYIKIAYLDARDDKDKDFAPVIMEISKALELTIKDIILLGYIDYLKSKSISIEKVPGLQRYIYVDKNGVAQYPLPEYTKKFSLGSVRHVLEIGESFDFRRSVLINGERCFVGEYVLEYFNEKCSYERFSGKDRKKKIVKYLKELSDEISIIVKLRNPAAHSNIMTKTDAEVCADCIILIKKVLINLLQSFVNGNLRNKSVNGNEYK